MLLLSALLPACCALVSPHSPQLLARYSVPLLPAPAASPQPVPARGHKQKKSQICLSSDELSIFSPPETARAFSGICFSPPAHPSSAQPPGKHQGMRKKDKASPGGSQGGERDALKGNVLLDLLSLWCFSVLLRSLDVLDCPKTQARCFTRGLLSNFCDLRVPGFLTRRL